MTVWHMKTWKPLVVHLLSSSVELVCGFVASIFSKGFPPFFFSSTVKTVLPLGEDPPAITSLCFNHNGKILAASATDGMIHMFGILSL